MRAVVVKTGWGSESNSISQYSSPFLWLLDRPLIQHVCEGLAGRNIRMVDWVHNGPSDDVRAFLGRGERWGMYFRHHLANSIPQCYTLSRAVLAGGGDGSPVLFGHADRMVPRSDAAHSHEASTSPVLLYGSQGQTAEAGLQWDGWAVLSDPACRQFPSLALAADEAALARLFAGHALGECRWEAVPRPYGARTLTDYLAANRAALADAAPALRIPHSARIHPTATIVGPVHIGRGVEVGAGAVVGPNVTVGAGCVIDRRAHVSDAVILPHTYVVAGAVLAHMMADRDRLYRPGDHGHAVAEPHGPVACLTRHPLSGLVPAVKSRARRAQQLISRLAGAQLTAPPAEAAPAAS